MSNLPNRLVADGFPFDLDDSTDRKFVDHSPPAPDDIAGMDHWLDQMARRAMNAQTASRAMPTTARIDEDASMSRGLRPP